MPSYSLETCSLKERSFLVQFIDVMREFGGIIPWLHGLRGVEYFTNPVIFESRILGGLKCDDESDIVPYHLVTSDESREFLGSVIHFKNSPEAFKDSRNQEIHEWLVGDGYHYLSCLQVRPEYRRTGLAGDIMNEVIQGFFERHQKVYAVISAHNRYVYHYLDGTCIRSKRENKDGLWIITWD